MNKYKIFTKTLCAGIIAGCVISNVNAGKVFAETPVVDDNVLKNIITQTLPGNEQINYLLTEESKYNLDRAGVEYDRSKTYSKVSKVNPEDINFNINKTTDINVTAVGDPVIASAEPVYVGDTTLENDSNITQRLSTQEFSKTISNSVTSSVTNGLKVGAKVTSKFQIPVVGETGVELSTEYNFSDTEGHTTTDSSTYIAKSQTIEVPAHTKAYVKVYLQQTKASGNVHLNALINGTVDLKFKEELHFFRPNDSVDHNAVLDGLVSFQNNHIFKPPHDGGEKEEIGNYDSTLSDALKTTSTTVKLPDTFKLTADGQNIQFQGTGKYEATYGTNMKVEVHFEDKSSNRVLGSKTFEVPVQVK